MIKGFATLPPGRAELLSEPKMLLAILTSSRTTTQAPRPRNANLPLRVHADQSRLRRHARPGPAGKPPLSQRFAACLAEPATHKRDAMTVSVTDRPISLSPGMGAAEGDLDGLAGQSRQMERRSRSAAPRRRRHGARACGRQTACGCWSTAPRLKPPRAPRLGGAAEFVPARYGDIWLRDTGPIFARTRDGAVALRFKTNSWGGKFDLPDDATVGDDIARLRRHARLAASTSCWKAAPSTMTARAPS